ncbi:MAG: hypothetical protein ACI9KE_003670 [Polyangiales bacterium]|jgi:hypothetical protein
MQPEPLNIPNPALKNTSKRNLGWAIGALGCGCLLLLIPITAAIAIPACINYVKRSKAAEARTELRSLGTSIGSLCAAGEDLSGLRAGPMPAVPSSLQSVPAWHTDPGFARLAWTSRSPVRYSYQIEPAAHDPTQLTLRASGDLDDDGILSSHVLSCDLRSCSCTRTPQVNDELE